MAHAPCSYHGHLALKRWCSPLWNTQSSWTFCNYKTNIIPESSVWFSHAVQCYALASVGMHPCHSLLVAIYHHLQVAAASGGRSTCHDGKKLQLVVAVHHYAKQAATYRVSGL